MKCLILKYISDLSNDVKGDIEKYIKENYDWTKLENEYFLIHLYI